VYNFTFVAPTTAAGAHRSQPAGHLPAELVADASESGCRRFLKMDVDLRIPKLR
jgi:hypothetical protein